MAIPDATDDTRLSIQLLRMLIPLVNAETIHTLGMVWRLVKRTVGTQVHEGIYEVLDFDACLDIRDANGHTALFTKREHVRFLQDNVIAYQDKVWGDGTPLATYRCSPGVAVDRYREGHYYRVLISLRETKNRGDTTDFTIERTIEDCFTINPGGFQIEIDHIVHQFSFSIIFPIARPPKRITMVETKVRRTIELGPEHRIRLPDGREQVKWRMNKPRLFESYLLRWEW